MLINRFHKLVLLPFWLLALSGCAAIVIPVSDAEVTSGRKIGAENIAFFKQGVTTRAEVIQALGQPDIDFKDLRIIVYHWSVRSAYVPWVVGSGGGGTGDIMEISDKYTLLIALDEKDYVSRSEITKVWPGTPIRSHTLKWVEREKLDVPKPSDRFVALEPPKGQAVLYVFRPGDWGDAPLLHQPAVSIDGSLVAELRKGGYISTTLEPGSHEVSVDPVPLLTTLPRPEQRPIRTLSFDATPDKVYYLKVKIKWGFGALDPELTMHTAAEAVPVIEKLRPTW